MANPSMTVVACTPSLPGLMWRLLLESGVLNSSLMNGSGHSAAGMSIGVDWKGKKNPYL
jgi:hypothetical protein